MTPTFGSLFSGIGGMDLGLERAGWECRWQVEIDPFCTKVLEKHWPKVKRFGDIRSVDWDDFEEVEHVDLLAGGFPCQPVSSSGKRLVQGDARWLWPEFARVIRTLRPEHVLLENVSDLLSRGFDDVAADLADAGYRFEWACLPAAAFGLPQRRWRVFVVADLDEGGRFVREERDGPRPKYFGRLDLDGLAVAQHRAQEAAAVVRGMDSGVPGRMDRNRALGNAVVPQVAEWIGRRILSYGL